MFTLILAFANTHDPRYSKFCAYGHTLDDLLKAAGATPLLDRGEGDAAADVNKHFTEWLVSMATAACSYFQVAALDLGALKNPLEYAALKPAVDDEVLEADWGRYIDFGTSTRVQSFAFADKEVLYEDREEVRSLICPLTVL